jgi:hypothetical protein
LDASAKSTGQSVAWTSLPAPAPRFSRAGTVRPYQRVGSIPGLPWGQRNVFVDFRFSHAGGSDDACGVSWCKLLIRYQTAASIDASYPDALSTILLGFLKSHYCAIQTARGEQRFVSVADGTGYRCSCHSTARAAPVKWTLSHAGPILRSDRKHEGEPRRCGNVAGRKISRFIAQSRSGK